MRTVQIKKGLNVPISGEPAHSIRQGNPVKTVAILGDDFIGMKPTMAVNVGDSVITGQLLFSDKKNVGIQFTSPGCGKVVAINRGDRRTFESLVIELDGSETHSFLAEAERKEGDFSAERIRALLTESGLWTSFRTRPYGKIPAIESSPASLFITAMESAPLAPPPEIIIGEHAKDFHKGLKILRRMLSCPIHYCAGRDNLLPEETLGGIDYTCFSGPHPSGLASTHIHFLDPVHENKTVWHLGYQDVTSIGHLFHTGELMTERIISLCGPAVKDPTLLRTRVGACLSELYPEQETDIRIISGSVLCGRSAAYLGRYHNQVSVIVDSDGRSLFNWAVPGTNRFSLRPVFTSALLKNKKFAMITAMWGGKRAIYPLGVYDEVMPLDIIATSLLKSISTHNTDKSKELGCLELIEEDLALCGFVCPGKNEFGADLRSVLNSIELGE